MENAENNIAEEIILLQSHLHEITNHEQVQVYLDKIKHAQKAIRVGNPEDIAKHYDSIHSINQSFK